MYFADEKMDKAANRRSTRYTLLASLFHIHLGWAAIENVNTIDEWYIKIVKNRVFDCHLSPDWRQMAIENTVSIEFRSKFLDCLKRFRLPPTRYDIAPFVDIPMLNIKYHATHKVKIHAGAIIKLVCGLCACTSDNPLS